MVLIRRPPNLLRSDLACTLPSTDTPADGPHINAWGAIRLALIFPVKDEDTTRSVCWLVASSWFRPELHRVGGGAQRRRLIRLIRGCYRNPPPRAAWVGRAGVLAELPNDGTPASGGTWRRSSRSRVIGPMYPAGSVLNFSFAATLIRVRNRSKDLWRSVTVDGTVSPDTASNASYNTAQLIRWMPSRTSKRMTFPSAVESAVDVLRILKTPYDLWSQPIAVRAVNFCRAPPALTHGSSPDGAQPLSFDAGRHRRGCWRRIDIAGPNMHASGFAV